MNEPRIDIMGVGFDPVSLEEAVTLVVGWVGKAPARAVVTPNSEIVEAAQSHAELRQALVRADLAIPDGIGVIWASRILGRPLAERVTGADLVHRLLEEGHVRGWRLFLLGARPGVAEKAAYRLAQTHPGLVICGTHHGYFSEAEACSVAQRVFDACPDLVLVGMGSPRQELWIDRYRQQAPGGVFLGVGGVVDLWAGMAPRAPAWMRRANLEWLYRIVVFRRFRRAVALLRFAGRTLSHRWQGRD
ncbi:MAG: WecB/TagA/CpsF family glycosyltransferase [Bacillota bacterium]